jgi:hypothetical protein
MRSPQNRHHRNIVAATLVALSVTVAGCAPAPRPPAGFDQRFLTRDATDVTTLKPWRDSLWISAPSTNAGGNSRTVFHRLSDPLSVDHGSCVTATHSGHPVQEGVALRISTSAGVTRAVTVTKNVWARADHIYNVHTWDTSRSQVLHQVASHDMGDALAGSSERRMCARVSGSTVEFKVWTVDLPEPSWGDPVATRAVTLPDGWVRAGRPGWYVGHVPPGGWASYRDMTISSGTALNQAATWALHRRVQPPGWPHPVTAR